MRRPPRLASDVELVALAHGGCDDSFGELARRHRAALVCACSRLVGADLAEDAAQQALLKALVALRSDATPPAQIRPWLLRVAHNASVDMLRRQALESGDASDAEGMDGRCPADVLEGRRELRAVVREIGKLPERQRQALLLRALEGHGYEEIARALGANEGMVRQLIYRARERVRAGAAAALVPIWLLRRSAPALKLAAATGAAATGAVVVGGVTAGSHHHGVAHAAVVEAPPVRPDRLPKVVAPAPARRPHRSAVVARAVHKRARVAAPKPPAARKVVAPRKVATPKPKPTPRPTPHRTTHHMAPPPVTPSPAPTPQPQPDPAPQPPAPSGPLAPAAAGSIVRYDQTPGFGGPLTIERSNGEHVTAYFGELVDLSCYFIRDGHVVSHETCTKDRLQPGTHIARAEHGINGSGHDVWTTIELILPSP